MEDDAERQEAIFDRNRVPKKLSVEGIITIALDVAPSGECVLAASALSSCFASTRAKTSHVAMCSSSSMAKAPGFTLERA